MNHGTTGMAPWLARHCVILILVVSASYAQVQAVRAASLPPVLSEALQGISGTRIADHMSFLASDFLEGRRVGSRGSEIAAAYIATQFALAGLRPAGPKGHYLQPFLVEKIWTAPETQLILKPKAGSPIPLKYGDDALVIDENGATEINLTAPIVFIGYGINDPATGENDFQKADLAGKVALMFDGRPPTGTPSSGLSLPHYDVAEVAYKLREAASHGAVGALIIHGPGYSNPSWAALRDSYGQGICVLTSNERHQLQIAGWIQADVARVLFEASAVKLKTMREAAETASFRPVQLPVQFGAHIVSKVTHSMAANVIGILPPRLPHQPQEAVLYSAHYGGLGRSADGTRIYDGAVDNASGTGMLLELARASGMAALRPPHPMLFVATAGDDDQLGMRYFAQHLPFSAKRIGLAINFDTVPPIAPIASIIVTGANAGRFQGKVQTLAARFDLRMEDNNSVLAGYQVLDGILPLAQAGIPSIAVNEGNMFRQHTQNWGSRQLQNYRAHRYHRPSDRFSADMNLSGNATLVRYALALGWTMDPKREVNARNWRSGALSVTQDKETQPENSMQTCSGC